jgi:hypothetical protein
MMGIDFVMDIEADRDGEQQEEEEDSDIVCEHSMPTLSSVGEDGVVLTVLMVLPVVLRCCDWDSSVLERDGQPELVGRRR